MTQRLYETDSYIKSFSAVVLSCEESDGAYFTVLDKTAFFPEGGGQAADKGTLGGTEVLDVQRKGDTVYHKLGAPLNVGDTVSGEINWELRYSRMQSHTGEHILSGVVHSLFGFDNIGFHMSEAVMTVDFSGVLKPADIEKIELEANKAIYKNSEIRAFYPEREELEHLNYRSKIEIQDDTRIVTIGDTDCCACCAPHLKRSGEVGLIKVISFCPNKQGTRIEMLAGINAFRDYALLNAENKALMGTLCAPRNGVKAAVNASQEALSNLRAETKAMARRLALYELESTSINGALLGFSQGISFDELRYCANTLLEKEQTCVLFSTNDEGALYVIASNTLDARKIAAELNSALCGKGGGKENYVQGKLAVKGKQEIKPIIEKILQA